MELVHATLRDQQLSIREADTKEPLLFAEGDWVWLENRRRRVGTNAKLQARFVGPYVVKKAFENHTYLIDRQGELSVQNEKRLKKYKETQTSARRAPSEGEPRRRKNMKGAVRRRQPRPTDGVLDPGSLPAEASAGNQPVLVPPSSAPECSREDTEALEREEPLLEEPSAADRPPDGVPGTLQTTDRPRRSAGLPAKYRDFELYRVEEEDFWNPGTPLKHLRKQLDDLKEYLDRFPIP
jgi:hypothetical protein